jgi:hypothetical protein
MNLYLLTQTEVRGYDTYDSCVVAAPDPATASAIHPSGKLPGDPHHYDAWDRDDWVSSPASVTVTLIGTAALGTPIGVICASFNAG